MASIPKVIWIAQWYPHEGEPYAGDFIQRHAKAVSLYMPVQLFACFPHTHNHRETITTDNLTETVIYFKPAKTGSKKLDKILLWYRWKRLLKTAIQKHIQQQGKPDFIHCHITLNAGWLGLWAKKKLGIPYLITEHWSGYMTGAFDGFANYNRLSRRLFHHIIQQATYVTTVSKALSVELQNIENQSKYITIPNVVDEAIFISQKHNAVSKKKRLLHISTFKPQKNMIAMLSAFNIVAEEIEDLEFHIVGPKSKFQKSYPLQAQNHRYILHGEIPQNQIASLMHQCDACVLYSHYETFGCVIIEANATGLPVIVSDIPVLREIVEQNKNGILVTPDNPDALSYAIKDFFLKENSFQPEQIALSARQLYSFPVVGKQFFELYKALMPTRQTEVKASYPH